jgi:hypothetical protein
MPKAAGTAKGGGDLLLMTGAEGKFYLLSLSGRIERAVDAHRGAILSGKWSHDGAGIVTGEFYIFFSLLHQLIMIKISKFKKKTENKIIRQNRGSVIHISRCLNLGKKDVSLGLWMGCWSLFCDNFIQIPPFFTIGYILLWVESEACKLSFCFMN